jgi:hypothetical protein
MIDGGMKMEWWIKEEKEKFENKVVKYNNALWTVKRVSWRNSEEMFEYYLEDNSKNSALVFEKNIEFVSV